jgi:hypothetical protein
MFSVADLTKVSPVLDSRAITFENITGARGAGGTVANGRKGMPQRIIKPGESVTIADVDGPATIRHIWMTFPGAPPPVMRALSMEVFYDDMTEPSISVPCLDFFGATLGRPTPMNTALTAIQEGRGFNSFIPIAFQHHIRIVVTNASEQPMSFFYQLDYTLGASADDGYLHCTFRRENPTTLKQDFVIEDGLRGPGRFLGCVVGIRCFEGQVWYGEGEVKIYRDGDTDYPTICGTGLEDYVGTAWGMGPHTSFYAGSQVDIRPPERPMGDLGNPDFVGFYRWHVVDPIMFEREMKVTIQQIGYDLYWQGQDERVAADEANGMVAGNGLTHMTPGESPIPLLAHGIVERVDDYCAVAFTVCKEAQAVPRLDVALAIADIERKPYEPVPPQEALASTFTHSEAEEPARV